MSITGIRRGYLQSASQEKHDQNDEDDSADSNSAIGTVRIVASPAAKQQQKNQDQEQEGHMIFLRAVEFRRPQSESLSTIPRNGA
jgi:hypothetical protein